MFKRPSLKDKVGVQDERQKSQKTEKTMLEHLTVPDAKAMEHFNVQEGGVS